MIEKEQKQKDFFQDYIFKFLIPKDHLLVKTEQMIDFSFVEEETKDLYCEGFGRPAYPPVVMFKMLFLEYLYEHSDVEVAKRCVHDVLYRYFLGLDIDDPTPDDTSLVVFRKRLGEERFEKLFNKIIEQCKQKQLLKERIKIIDASKIVADVAIPNTVNLLRQGRRAILREVIKMDRDDGRRLARKYLRKEKLYTKPNEEELSNEINLSKRFLGEIKGKYSDKITKLIEGLEKVISGDKENRVVSFVDLDARFGMTGQEKKDGFCGYKVHIAEDESEIITSCDVLKGNEIEGKTENLGILLQKEEEKGIKGEAVVCDAIYESGPNRNLIKEKNMKPCITQSTKNRRQMARVQT